jgi:hypothetical protein
MCSALWRQALPVKPVMSIYSSSLSEKESEGAFNQFMGFKERMEAILERPVDLITGKRFRNPYFQQAVEEQKKLIYAA